MKLPKRPNRRILTLNMSKWLKKGMQFIELIERNFRIAKIEINIEVALTSGPLEYLLA